MSNNSSSAKKHATRSRDLEHDDAMAHISAAPSTSNLNKSKKKASKKSSKTSSQSVASGKKQAVQGYLATLTGKLKNLDNQEDDVDGNVSSKHFSQS
jgi:hypothetical protein